jgi:hypothetical protein
MTRIDPILIDMILTAPILTDTILTDTIRRATCGADLSSSIQQQGSTP